VNLIAAILVYAVICELYIFLFTLAANGVSISIMDRLADGLTSLQILDAEYSVLSMVTRRVDQLQTGGFLIECDGHLLLSLKGRGLVRAFLLLRRTLQRDARVDVL